LKDDKACSIALISLQVELCKMVDHEDWGVTHNFFEFIDNLWGPHSVDRFDSVVNKKISRFTGETHFFVPKIQ
jgi:hypothetical protein